MHASACICMRTHAHARTHARTRTSLPLAPSPSAVLKLALDGTLKPVCAHTPPPAPVRASGLAEHLANRQSEPHNHALVLAPGTEDEGGNALAFVPDLGLDVIREPHFRPAPQPRPQPAPSPLPQRLGAAGMYVYDRQQETLHFAGSMPCAPADEGPHGPRYIEFSEADGVAYVVNELSSTVSCQGRTRCTTHTVHTSHAVHC